ncbi:Inositol-pentakisphosphate 2-kinase [Asimina triloba]
MSDLTWSEFFHELNRTKNIFQTFQKTVVSVDMLCLKCQKKVMKLVAGVEGINSIVLDSAKGTATIIGDADPVVIIKKVRKFRKSAALVSIGPPKEEKKENKELHSCVPKTCQKCNTWYIVSEDSYSMRIFWKAHLSVTLSP